MPLALRLPIFDFPLELLQKQQHFEIPHRVTHKQTYATYIKKTNVVRNAQIKPMNNIILLSEPDVTDVPDEPEESLPPLDVFTSFYTSGEILFSIKLIHFLRANFVNKGRFQSTLVASYII